MKNAPKRTSKRTPKKTSNKTFKTTPKRKPRKSIDAWNRLAARKLAELLSLVAPGKPKAGRKSPPAPLQADVRLVGAAPMRRLNLQYRGKDYATDVLSFEAPPHFQAQGVLGGLVICLPVLQRQAREREHAAERELEVLLVHGLLHLLGYDHEKGPRHFTRMAREEERLLAATFKSTSGLIKRSRSGKS